MDTNNKKSINDGIVSDIEAIIFVFGVSVSDIRIAEILEVSLDEVRQGIERLIDSYESRQSGLKVLYFDGNVQIVTNPKQSEIIAKFKKKELEGELSDSALEVLAIIAYRGPISKQDIELIRGVNCSFLIKKLLLRKLISKKTHPTNSRGYLYNVTIDFLRFLGVNSREQLPDFEKLSTDKRIDAVIYSKYEDE